MAKSTLAVEPEIAWGKYMENETVLIAKLLAEVLRLQRWAGGDSIPASRILGLLHGFETELRNECKSFGISEETQDKVEDLLEAVESGQQSPKSESIKSRLKAAQIKEADAIRVMELCWSQSRFTEGIEAIATAPRSRFRKLAKPRHSEQNWFGALHHMELVDCSAGKHAKMYAVLAPSVPCIGEIVTPQLGTQMKVIDVEHVVISQGDEEGITQRYLVPHILLESIEQSDD